MIEYDRIGKEGPAKTGQGSEDGESVHNRGGLEASTTESSSPRHEQIGFGGSDSDTRIKRRNVGGILRQLKQSMEEHLAYVDAHTERLKARLAEDEAQRRKLLAEMAALEEDLKQIEEREEEIPE